MSKARFAVGIIMLVLAFFGMVVTDVYKGGSWDYWKWVVPIYAILALGLSIYVKKAKETYSPKTLFHEALHWAGLIGSIFLTSHFSALGLMSRFEVGLVHLVLVALAVFTAGIYIEPIFLFIGLCIGGFAFLAAAFVEYIYAVAVPVLIGCAILFGIWVWLSHRKGPTTPNG
jgi:hypothetical protein